MGRHEIVQIRQRPPIAFYSEGLAVPVISSTFSAMGRVQRGQDGYIDPQGC